jgi:hypothetical protein
VILNLPSSINVKKENKYISIRVISDDKRTYLSNKAFNGGQLVHGESHLPHVVRHVKRIAQ